MLIAKNGKHLNINKISFDELLLLTEKLQPQFYHALSMLKNKDEYVFYKAKYKFGDPILQDTKIYFSSNDGQSMAIDDPDLPDDLVADLIYDVKTEDPLAMFLNKVSEAYYAKDNDAINSILLSKGSFIGIPRALNTTKTRSSIADKNINAGCKSIFMLPKISIMVD